MQQELSRQEQLDLPAMVADLNNLLRLKTTVIGMKMFARADEMAAIPKIRRPKSVHTTDQIVSMASRLGWTVGITAEDLVGNQCRAGIGLAPRAGRGAPERAAAAQRALVRGPAGRARGLAVSPGESGRPAPPNIVLVYATP